MTYAIKEIFYTLQGEGAQSGRAAVFCRFVGCNLWSGRKADRATAVCRFCDTDFLGADGPDGGTFDDEVVLAQKIEEVWQEESCWGERFVVLTGGEPLLQVDKPLIDELHARQFEIAVETNGTVLAPSDIDWICVSPKAGTKIIQTFGNELKFVFPQTGLEPEYFANMAFNCFSLQPMDGPNRERNTEAAIRYCLKNPMWRLSLQTHKFLRLR